MNKNNYKNLTLNQFEKKEIKDTDITQKDKPQIKTPPNNNPRDLESFYRRYRHIS